MLPRTAVWPLQAASETAAKPASSGIQNLLRRCCSEPAQGAEIFIGEIPLIDLGRHFYTAPDAVGMMPETRTSRIDC